MGCGIARFGRRGLLTPQNKFHLSHILDSNGVWYCSFLSEGSINPLKLKMLVLKFVPRDLEWQRSGTLNGASNDGTVI